MRPVVGHEALGATVHPFDPVDPRLDDQPALRPERVVQRRNQLSGMVDRAVIGQKIGVPKNRREPRLELADLIL